MNAFHIHETPATDPAWGFGVDRIHHQVYRMTLAGQDALVRSDVALRPEVSRLLAMVNGRRSGEQLAATIRSGEGADLLRQLEIRGWIEPIATLPRFASDPCAIEECLAEQRFFAAKSAAEAAARELLGSHYSSYALAFAGCINSRELRPLVQSVCDRLTRTLGADAATVFIEAVRDAANPQADRM
ncbi:MAG: hypothetical protein EAZ24_05865 [Burkholderiales bacterium]|nr:MAG: hypothetical protein EAZ24_05865 [Burkholderiales bacterium]